METTFQGGPDKPPELQQKIRQDFHKYLEMDLDELLEQLTPEELQLLEDSEMSDPDNSMLPPADRVRDQTKKTPTGKFERQKLLKFLEEKAKQEQDWDEKKPFAKETRGKVWVPKELSSLSPERSSGGTRGDEDMISIDLPDDYEKALNSASEAELIDLADVLERRVVCDRCLPGYTGHTCSECGDGHYQSSQSGEPGLRCDPCQCNQHTGQHTGVAQCEDYTGRCIQCDHHTTGDHCDQCRPGYVGDPTDGGICVAAASGPSPLSSHTLAGIIIGSLLTLLILSYVAYRFYAAQRRKRGAKFSFFTVDAAFGVGGESDRGRLLGTRGGYESVPTWQRRRDQPAAAAPGSRPRSTPTADTEMVDISPAAPHGRALPNRTAHVWQPFVRSQRNGYQPMNA